MKTDNEKISEVMRKLGSISDAYDAWWFIYYHPKFIYFDRLEVSPEDATTFEPAMSGGKPISRLIQDKGGNYWQEWFPYGDVHALNENLGISYVKVDGTGRINDESSKNIYTECWLEFGPIEWGYGTDWQIEDHKREHKMNYHDYNLDCGGKTFDEALVNLANLVLKHYGDYNRKEEEE